MPRLLIAVLLISVSFAGCTIGGGDSHKDTKTEKRQQGKKEKKDPNSCEARGINVREGKAGTCIRDKQRFTLVNRHSTLPLKELSVKLGKFSSETSLQGPVGTVKPKKGQAFVLFDVTWRNKDDRAHVLNQNPKQLKLRLAGNGFPVAMNAESAFPTSFFNLNKKIKPGAAQRGTAIFSVKDTAVKALTQRGADPQFLVWNFSTVGKDKPADGAIRLWK